MTDEVSSFLASVFLIAILLLIFLYKIRKRVPSKYLAVHQAIRKIINGCWFTCFMILLMFFNQQ